MVKFFGRDFGGWRKESEYEQSPEDPAVTVKIKELTDELYNLDVQEKAMVKSRGNGWTEGNSEDSLIDLRKQRRARLLELSDLQIGLLPALRIKRQTFISQGHDTSDIDNKISEFTKTARARTKEINIQLNEWRQQDVGYVGFRSDSPDTFVPGGTSNKEKISGLERKKSEIQTLAELPE